MESTRNIKNDLNKIKAFEKELFAGKGFLEVYALRGDLQGDIDTISSSLSPNEKERLLKHRELNSLAGKCGLNEFTDSELEEIDNICISEITDSIIAGLKDIKD